MPGVLTEVTEIATALGTLAPDLSAGLAVRPTRLRNVDDATWQRLVAAFEDGQHRDQFETAFENGAALLRAEDGLRGRPPKLVEWKGPHRPPGDDVIPADLRVDHVYQVSCKYLSRIMLNAGPARLFDRLLIGEERTGIDWFGVVAPGEYQAFYDATRAVVGGELPRLVSEIDVVHRSTLKVALRPRLLPPAMQDLWRVLCRAVASASAIRWGERLVDKRARLRMLWRLLRIGDAPYFVLGADGSAGLQLRVASAWDWMQEFELRSFAVHPRHAGQPEVGWRALVRMRSDGTQREVHGHVEIRWSHGRFQGAPEAKVYLDTPHGDTPGYFALV
jgi:hypothetical protein